MAKKALIIVESPAKIKTLKKFLGPTYAFESSIGHIRDLPKKDFGIDMEGDFEPVYQTMPDKKQVIENLRRAAKDVEVVYLAPDPDREGEAIAWHIAEILPKGVPYKRVSFNAITRDEVTKALSKPREIDIALVNAQQARRLLDRIVGYKISPILNRRLQRGRTGFVSAGRVQSVALKLVVDREKEIDAFNPIEYWNLGANLTKDDEERIFKTSLYSIDGKKVEKEAIKGKNFALISNKESAEAIVAKLKSSKYRIGKVERKQKKRHPQPPFITSTIQQEASRHHGYSSSRTMSLAQQLYEGIDLGNEGTEGLITYMRTDSVRVEPVALNQARDYIKKTFGDSHLPEKPRFYSTKKNSQDAHEAIRPTNLDHHPELVRPFLTKEQFNLYSLIWKRFVASQMESAIYDTISANIETDKGLLLRATGSVLKFTGYLAAYREREDDTVDGSDDDTALPDLQEGTDLNLVDVFSEQSFTRPPPRFTEASLVKELEKSGIGRPSTYAAIMNKIQSREYTVKESGRLKPTELGKIIAQMLENHFGIIMNIDFTANMENSLELVAEDQKNWRELLREFWTEFEPVLNTATEEATVPRLETDIDCPECGKKLQKIWFKTKYFYGCIGYPDCRYTVPVEQLEFDKNEYAEDFKWEQKCPKCEAEMKLRFGKFGAFLGCSTYPDCRGIVQIPKKGEVVIPEEDLPDCPAKGCPGKLSARRSRFGKTFYSCTTYPDCDVIVNTLEQVETKYPDHTRTPYVKKTKGGKKATKTTKKKAAPKKRVLKPAKASKALEDLIGLKEIDRAQALKKVWEYIKAKNLQNPENKREIMPDEKLGKVFGSQETILMTKIMGLVNKQLTTLE